jgi:hypothetical protein
MDTSVATKPRPPSATVCGLLEASSVIVSVPVWFPVWVGAKLTAAVQLAPAANVAGEIGQALVSGKSAELLAMLLMLNTVAWLFVTVTLTGALVVPTG